VQEADNVLGPDSDASVRTAGGGLELTVCPEIVKPFNHKFSFSATRYNQSDSELERSR
jgi:hypothetical protein